MVDRVTEAREKLAAIKAGGYNPTSQRALEAICEDLIAASDKERQTPEGWQAIDSAPKDGTEILLYGPGVLFMDGRTSMYAKARHIGWWHNDFWVTRDPAVTCRATSWMPLAAIPASDAPDARTLLQSTEGQ